VKRRLTRAGLAAILALASGVPLSAGNTVVSPTISPTQPNNNREQAPAVPQARAAAVIAQLGGGFSYYRNLAGSGIPWPGRAAARARHHAGSGRRPK